MDKKFQEYKGLDLSQVNKDVLKEWESNNTFEQSLKNREGHPSFVFADTKLYKDFSSSEKPVGIHTGYPLNWGLKRNSVSRKKISGKRFPWPTTTKNVVPTS